MAKTKPQETTEEIPLIEYENNDAVTIAIKELGDTNRKREKIKSEYDAKIAVLQNELQEKISPLEEQINLIGLSLENYFEKRKDLFFNDKKKSIEFTTGVVGYRKNPDYVEGKFTKKILDGILNRNSLLAAVETFEKKMSKVFLRVKLELNKEAILLDPKKALKVTGLKVKEGEDNFYVTPNETNIEG
jgi:phage host-nuclease inhibitor protein Gam